MNNHTPSPWYIHDEYPDIVVDKDGVKIAAIYGDTKQQRAIDAQLIAAAPELLYSIELFISHLFDGPDDSDIAMMFNKVKQAINKAKGIT